MITWQRGLTQVKWSVIFLYDFAVVISCKRCCLFSSDFIWLLRYICICWINTFSVTTVDFWSTKCFRKANGKSSWYHFMSSLSLSLESLFILAWWVWLLYAHAPKINLHQKHCKCLFSSQRKNNATDSWGAKGEMWKGGGSERDRCIQVFSNQQLRAAVVPVEHSSLSIFN